MTSQRPYSPIIGYISRDATTMDDRDLSRVLSLIISLLTDPYDRFIDQLHADGRISDDEIHALRQALKDQIPKVSSLIRAKGDGQEEA